MIPSDYYILPVLLYHRTRVTEFSRAHNIMSLFCNRNHDFFVLKNICHCHTRYNPEGEEKTKSNARNMYYEVNCSWHNSQWQNQSGCAWKPYDWTLSSQIHSSRCYSSPASPEHWLRCSPDPSLQHPSWFHTGNCQ